MVVAFRLLLTSYRLHLCLSPFQDERDAHLASRRPHQRSFYNPFELCEAENRRFRAAIVKLDRMCARVWVECDHDDSVQG
jgi:hypothetical protein